MVEVDRRMEQEVGIDLPQMMENAGRSLADLAIGSYDPSRVVVVYGSGGNGGGALVAARHLVNRGVEVQLVASSSSLRPVTHRQHQILMQMGVLDVHGNLPSGADLLIDGMIGYSLRGDPRGRAAELVGWANNQTSTPVLSLDVPSGFSAAEGRPFDPHVKATTTLTLALPKTGMVGHGSVGRLFLADISVPQVVYKGMGLDVPTSLFAHGQVVELV